MPGRVGLAEQMKLMGRFLARPSSVYVLTDEAFGSLERPIQLLPGTSISAYVIGDLSLVIQEPFIYLDYESLIERMACIPLPDGLLVRGDWVEIILTEPDESDLAALSIRVRTAERTLELLQRRIIIDQGGLLIYFAGHVLVNAIELNNESGIFKLLSLFTSRTTECVPLKVIHEYTEVDAVAAADEIATFIRQKDTRDWQMALFTLLHALMMSPMPATIDALRRALINHTISEMIEYHTKQIAMTSAFLRAFPDDLLEEFLAILMVHLSVTDIGVGTRLYPFQTGVMSQFGRALSGLYYDPTISQQVKELVKTIFMCLTMGSGYALTEARSRLGNDVLFMNPCFSAPTPDDLLQIYLSCYEIAYVNEFCQPGACYAEVVMDQYHTLSLTMPYILSALPEEEATASAFLNRVSTFSSAQDWQDAIPKEVFLPKYIPNLFSFGRRCACLLRAQSHEARSHILSVMLESFYEATTAHVPLCLFILAELSYTFDQMDIEPECYQQWVSTTFQTPPIGYSPSLLYIFFGLVTTDLTNTTIDVARAVLAYSLLNTEGLTLRHASLCLFCALVRGNRYELILTDIPSKYTNSSVYACFQRAINDLETPLMFRPRVHNARRLAIYSEESVEYQHWRETKGSTISPPLDPETSDKPTVSDEVGEDDNYEACAICLLPLPGDQMILDCNHGFCPDCAARTLLMRRACPICRREPLALRLADEGWGLWEFTHG
ncbi:Ring finger domain-containing protein [Giardia muris]|uniref:Ring finger domain-containing protein n=1 Tax=Giardia muris TaxID=5742 RepID=A0A4Z1SXT7_GIAMU|nr:Ring finger domain-containing protein [Giardia muris]|eukprot:TNJ30524.1 Ring finger domain-containing protein [Giardia muris]